MHRSIAIAIIAAACSSPGDEPPDTGPSWSGVSSDDAAPPVFVLHQDAQGRTLSTDPPQRLCPADTEWLGGLGLGVSCLAESAGYSVALTRSLDGHTVATDGLSAVCGAELEPIGQRLQVAVCRGDGAARIAYLTHDDSEVTPGPADPACPVGWQALGYNDQAIACRQVGAGSIAVVSRDTDGNSLAFGAEASALCPVGLDLLGQLSRESVCDWPGLNTVIELTRGIDEPVADEPSCPSGFVALGGRGFSRVCGVQAALSVAVLSRDANGVGWPALNALPEPCPTGFSRAGGLEQAIVCVQR